MRGRRDGRGHLPRHSDRGHEGLVAAGGNLYLLIKIGGAVGQNLLQIGAQMRGESLEEFLETRPGHRDTAVEGTN